MLLAKMSSYECCWTEHHCHGNSRICFACIIDLHMSLSTIYCIAMEMQHCVLFISVVEIKIFFNVCDWWTDTIWLKESTFVAIQSNQQGQMYYIFVGAQYFCPILTKFWVLWQIFIDISSIEFHQNPCSGSVVHTYRLSNGQMWHS